MFAQNALVAETGKLQRFAMRLTRNKADADDLLQSTCLRAIEKADRFEDGSNLFGWTSKIMYNLFVTGYRRKVKFESMYNPDPDLEAQASKPAQDTNMEVADIKRALSRISTDHRDILIMTCVEGRTYQEVSEIIQMPVGTVRSRLSRAREQLKNMMGEPHDIYSNVSVPIIPAYIASHALTRIS